MEYLKRQQRWSLLHHFIPVRAKGNSAHCGRLKHPWRISLKRIIRDPSARVPPDQWSTDRFYTNCIINQTPLSLSSQRWTNGWLTASFHHEANYQADLQSESFHHQGVKRGAAQRRTNEGWWWKWQKGSEEGRLRGQRTFSALDVYWLNHRVKVTDVCRTTTTTVFVSNKTPLLCSHHFQRISIIFTN